MKIYEFKYIDGDVIEWIFAPNKREAKKFYQSHTGGVDFNEYTIKSIPQENWVNLYLLDTDSYVDAEDQENEDDYCRGYKIIMNFQQFADSNSVTDIIASTDY